MTKKEIKNTINKVVYEYAESLGYRMEDNGDGGRVIFVNTSDDSLLNDIEYHRSTHDTYVMKEASIKTRLMAAKIMKYAQAIKADVEWKLAMENGDVE